MHRETLHVGSLVWAFDLFDHHIFQSRIERVQMLDNPLYRLSADSSIWYPWSTVFSTQADALCAVQELKDREKAHKAACVSYAIHSAN